MLNRFKPHHQAAEAPFTWQWLLCGLIWAASWTVHANSPCLPAPDLPAPTGTIINVHDVTELHQAINGIAANTTVLLEPGDYALNSTLWIQQDNITIRGNSDRCDAVNLIGRGMENANFGGVPHGIWTNAAGLTLSLIHISAPTRPY